MYTAVFSSDSKRIVAASKDGTARIWQIDPLVLMRPSDYFVRNAAHFLADFVIAPAHEALDRIHSILGIRDRLALGYLAHQPLAGLVNGHH